MELFEYIELLFDRLKQKEWNNLVTSEKVKNQFMLNRFMAIRYPTYAKQLNVIKTDGLGVAEVWRMVASRFYKGVPKFIYTKTAKGAKKDNPLAKISKEAISFWCDRNECGLRELNEHLDFNLERTLDELKYIEKNYITKDKSNKENDND